jgi:anti-anti-sigma regulatory factor
MNAKTVSFVGNFTQKEAIDFKEQLLTEIKSGNKNLTVDLYEVAEADIVGVNALAIAHKTMGDANGKIQILLKKDSHISHLLQVTKFNKVLHISYA